MAALTTAAMAVSVVVLAPSQSSPLERHAYAVPASATVGQAVQTWSEASGLPSPQIDSRIASVSVGNLTVSGSNVCEAVQRLVSALKYADQRPELIQCNTDAAAPIIIRTAAR